MYSKNMTKLVQVYQQFEINYKLRQEYKIENQSEEEKTHHAISQS